MGNIYEYRSSLRNKEISLFLKFTKLYRSKFL